MKKRVITILGARPQFIKAAVLSREIQNYKNLEEILVHTGQHYDEKMSRAFFNGHQPNMKSLLQWQQHLRNYMDNSIGGMYVEKISNQSSCWI